jgi:hypothetical protein
MHPAKLKKTAAALALYWLATPHPIQRASAMHQLRRANPGLYAQAKLELELLRGEGRACV